MRSWQCPNGQYPKVVAVQKSAPRWSSRPSSASRARRNADESAVRPRVGENPGRIELGRPSKKKIAKTGPRAFFELGKLAKAAPVFDDGRRARFQKTKTRLFLFAENRLPPHVLSTRTLFVRDGEIHGRGEC